MNGATARQREVLRTIIARDGRIGLREIGRELRIASTHAVHCHIDALRRKGYLRMPPPDGSKSPVREYKVTSSGYRAAGDEPEFHRTLHQALTEHGLSHRPSENGRRTIYDRATREVVGSNLTPREAWQLVWRLEEA